MVVRAAVDRAVDPLVEVDEHAVGSPARRRQLAEQRPDLVQVVVRRALGGQPRRLRLKDRAYLAEAREWAQKILAKKPTMPGYLRRRERPWFRKANGLLLRLRAS